MPLQRTAQPEHLPMLQHRHPVKSALQGITVCLKMLPQEIQSLAIMPVQEGITVLVELDWTGNHVPVVHSVTKQPLAW